MRPTGRPVKKKKIRVSPHYNPSGLHQHRREIRVVQAAWKVKPNGFENALRSRFAQVPQESWNVTVSHYIRNINGLRANLNAERQKPNGEPKKLSLNLLKSQLEAEKVELAKALSDLARAYPAK